MNIEPPPLPNQSIPEAELVADPPIERIQLTISSLFVWMAMIGFELFLNSKIYARVFKADASKFDLLYFGVHCFTAIFLTATMATWGYVIARIWKRIPFPTQPGHWLCLLISLNEMVAAIAYSMNESMEFNAVFPTKVFLFLFAAATTLIPILFSKDLGIWRVTFYLIFATKLGSIAYLAIPKIVALTSNQRITSRLSNEHIMAWSSLQKWMFSGVIAWMFSLWVVELVKGRKRDWVHHLGVAAYFAVAIATWIMTIGARLLRE